MGTETQAGHLGGDAGDGRTMKGAIIERRGVVRDRHSIVLE